MTIIFHQPNLAESLSLIGWRLKRNAEIQARKDEPNFECEVEPSSRFNISSESTFINDNNDDAHNHVDLHLGVDSIDLNNTDQQTNDDYDPHEVFMRINTRRTITGHNRSPLAVLPSQLTTNSNPVNNYRCYNFADDDTSVKYPIAIRITDKNSTQFNIPSDHTSRSSFDSAVRLNSSSYHQSSSKNPYQNNLSSKLIKTHQLNREESLEKNLYRHNELFKNASTRNDIQNFRTTNPRSSFTDDDVDNDIAPTVTEMDMIEDEEDNQSITKSLSSSTKLSTSNMRNDPQKYNEKFPEFKKMEIQGANLSSSSNQTNNLLNKRKYSYNGEEVINGKNHYARQMHENKQSNNIQSIKRYHESDDYDDNDDQNQMRKRTRFNDDHSRNQEMKQQDYQQMIRVPARRGRPPFQHYQEDSSKKGACIISQFEERHGIKLGEMRVFAPKLRLRISNVNIDWIKLPTIPKFPNKVHKS